MENKKSYYEDDSRNMRDFNPRFHDLYRDYSDSQHGNHTFNLNGIIYVHNHHGGEPVPVGKVKSPLSSKPTARPNRSPSQRERRRANTAAASRLNSGAAAVRSGSTGTVRANGGTSVSNRARTGQGAKNGWARPGSSPSSRAMRGFIIGFCVLFVIAMVVPIVAGLREWDGGFTEEDDSTYEEVNETSDIQERDTLPLEDAITEEGVVYIMDGYIQIGATADTLWETYDTPGFAPQEPVQPGENYYVFLDLGEKYGVASITLQNMGDTAVQDVNQLVIWGVSADYYTEFDEDFETNRTETDCEIIGGITIGMDYGDAMWALTDVCGNPQILESSEGNRGHLVGYSDKYYYSIALEDDKINQICVNLKETDSEQ